MFAAQCHQVFDTVSCFASTHATRLNVVNIVCHRTAYLTRDKITGRIAEMLEIYLCMFLQRCKVCSIFNRYFLIVDNYLKKTLQNFCVNACKYKKLYYLCCMEHNKTITYSYLDSKDWKEKTRTAEIDFIKTYAANDFAVHLKNGKVIFVEPIRTELWGKSGKRLSIINSFTFAS